MNRVIQISKLEETTLWKKVNEKDPVLAGNLTSICGEASDRMKAMPTYAPQFTLHDERHSLRMTELMALILGSDVSALNSIEMALLILGAFFHDQGMVLSPDEHAAMQRQPQFQLYKDKWVIEHPNYGEITRQLSAQSTSETERLRLAGKIAEMGFGMVTEFIRTTHADRSADFARTEYGADKRLEIQGVNLSSLLARLCGSHGLSAQSLTPQNGFRFDEQTGTSTINMQYLSVVLRLADILDFDRDRTPEVLFKSIHFTNEVSLREWEKHRCVEGWTISPTLIRFSMKSSHPAYEASARQYMNWIDAELIACNEVVKSEPKEFDRYRLDLPTHVDRSRIEPLENAYRYHDLEFQLSRDEIVRLLMTDKLYGQPNLCIRELLQNSLDALRYRKALFANAGIRWHEGRIILRHFVDENGFEIIQCSDNGSGMDEDIIANHFVKIGRSFYRSPDFDRERARLRATGNDFDPCSKFGIGFMSCFMLGDQITIETRRDYGQGRDWGRPLVVEIHGLSGLLILRDATSTQAVGTTVSIRSRQKPSFLDSWTDQVRLTTILKGYALATEFPIMGECTRPEVSDRVTIPPQAEEEPTLLEIAGIKNIVSLNQDLSEVNASLQGMVRDSFLLDARGLPCVETTEAQWSGYTQGPKPKWRLHLLADGRDVECDLTSSVPLCVDGILVAGTPGRPSYRKEVQMRLGWRNSNIHCISPALVDARGDMKPEMTPGRTPPEHIGLELPPGWRRLNDSFHEGLGLLWRQLANYLGKGLDEREFWKLVVIYGVQVPCIPHQTLWDLVSVSLVDQAGQSFWYKIRDLGDLSIVVGGSESFELQDARGKKVGPDSSMKVWEKQGEDGSLLHWHMNSTTLLTSSLDVRDGRVVLRPNPPSDPQIALSQFAISYLMGVSLFLIDYVGAASNALAVETPFPTANRRHPLVRVCHDARYVRELTDLQTFAKAFVPCIAETVSSKDKTPSFEQPGYWQKRVAHLYFAVQWNHYNSDLKPPYKVWTVQKGWFGVDERTFIAWRDSPAEIR
jgi:hypothetical protein